MFVLDCSPAMFVKLESDDDDCHVDKCLKCIQSICQKKVLNSEKDLLAIVLYGLVSY